MPTQTRKTTLLAIDHSGAVLNAIDTARNNAIAYSAYGHSQLNASQSQIRFNGEFQELMTGYYPLGNGYRMYSPVLMRFLSPDSLSPFGAGGMNAYVYCGGDPRNRHDSNGHAFQFFSKIKIPRPTFKYAGKASNGLTGTPVSTTLKTWSTYDSVGSISSKRSFSSNYESIKSYSSVGTVPSVPMHSPPPTISHNSISSIGPSPSDLMSNPAYAPIQGVTIKRAAHGNTKSSMSEWANSTTNIPDEQLEKFSQIPRPGAKPHTEKHLAVRANGIRKEHMLLALPNVHRRASNLPSWFKY